ncbi:MAG: NADH:flavin oxidoreductase [Planctomycetota bacterium]|nr:MAG: NADH:flavin oxidoreductase [Planctomycetota bacterium]
MAEPTSYPKVAQLRTVAALQKRLDELGVALPIDSEVLAASAGSPLAQPLQVGRYTVGNRWCIHPMEGWDANPDGSPSELTLRRWGRFGESGAKLIWGGEAAAVQPRGRANPNQTLAVPQNAAGLEKLLQRLRESHRQAMGSEEGLLVGLQLTHSGRFCKPHDHHRWEPLIAYHHPLLDAKFGIDPADASVVITDDDVARLIDDYVAAAKTAEKVGFQFVDIKACHGYLLHEFLSARSRPGPYGGDLAGRARLLLTIIDRVREACPHLVIGVRLSVADTLPYRQVGDQGQPMDWDRSVPYLHGFGVRQDDPTQVDLSEPLQLIQWLTQRGVELLNVTLASPYYSPHLQRPAIFPPSDGYPPPEDPLVGVARHLDITARIKREFPRLAVVGSGYTYLQEHLPRVAQAAVKQGMVDFVGLGRMVLSYPELPRDVLAGRTLQRKLICRTFSECTTAPRHGLPSGCYPLDPFYKQRPEREVLVQIKQGPKDA